MLYDWLDSVKVNLILSQIVKGSGINFKINVIYLLIFTKSTLSTVCFFVEFVKMTLVRIFTRF